MINFESIRWKNLLSTGNVWTEITLNDAKTTLIIGENGAGKSTILDAICYALYGKPFRKINKPQLINTVNNKDMVVEIRFSIGKKNYLVRRGMKPNLFEVYQGDKLLNQAADNRDYQEILTRQILKIDYRSFCQVVILGSASFVPFMQLPAAHRREVIEDLLDIQIFTTMNLLLREKLSGNNTKLLEADYKYDLASEKIKLNEKHMGEMTEDTDKAIAELEDKVINTKSRLTSEEAKIDDLIRLRNEKMEEIGDTPQRLEEKRRRLQVFEMQLNEKIEKLNKEVEFFNHYDNCPTCKQNIDSHFKSNMITEKLDLRNEVEMGMSQLATKLQEAETSINAVQAIQREITDINIRISSHTSTAKGLENLIKDAEKQIDDLKKKKEKIANRTIVADLEKELEEVGKVKQKLLDEKEVMSVVSVLLKDSGIKSKIIKQYIPIINKLINKYLAAMDFFVQFQLNEQFEETILSRYRDNFSYASFSEGEKMRINLAILFTWRAIAKLRNSASTNLLILDEIFDGSLDSQGTEEFMKILTNIIGDTNTFIISHKIDSLQDKFERVIRFEKHKTFSRIAA